MQVRKTVIGLARDLRGVAFAFNTKVKTLKYRQTIYRLVSFIEFWWMPLLYQEKHILNTLLSDFLHDAVRLDLPNLHPGDAEGSGNLVPGSSGDKNS